MKFKNETITAKSTVVITLKRGTTDVPLTVSAYTPNVFELWRTRGLKQPQVPKVSQKDPVTKQWLKDANGVIVVDYDHNDPGYLAAYDLWADRLYTLRIYDALRFCDDITFETEEPAADTEDPKVWLQFLDNLSKEISDPDTGLSLGEGRKIAVIADKLDGRIEVEPAMKDFLSDALED